MLELNRRARVGASASVLASLVLVGCERKLESAECTKLLDRYTELLVVDEEPGAAPEKIAQAQARAREAAEKDPRFEFSSCRSRVARRQYECAMSAPNVDAVERCLVF